MLLTVVHANGSYYPSLGLNELPCEMQARYHDRLSRLVCGHLLKKQPVAYLPYWVDPERTGIHHDVQMQAAALAVDPFYQSLVPDFKPAVHVIPDGPELCMDFLDVISRDAKLDELAKSQKRVCFVGAYAGACVITRAKSMLNRMDPIERPEIFVDPNYCVDISTAPVSRFRCNPVNLESYSIE